MLKIAVAKTPEQIDALLKLRYQVLVEEEEKFEPNCSGRLVEKFDAFPTTTNLIVTQDEQLVGSMRLTLGTQQYVPMEDSADFNDLIPREVKVLGCSMYCIKKGFRNTQVMLGLLLMASYLGLSHQVNHIIAPTDLKLMNRLKRAGFNISDSETASTHTDLDISPLLLNIKQDLKDFFATFAEHNKIEGSIHAYECAFYEPGEYIIRKGEVGDCAFVLVDGEVEVQHAEYMQSADRMTPGAVFGEMSLLSDQVRSANILAKTKVRVMILEKSVFIKYLTTEPTMALSMLKSMSDRMSKLIQNRPLAATLAD